MPSSSVLTKLSLRSPLAVVSYYDSVGDYQKDDEILRTFPLKDQFVDKVGEQSRETKPYLPIPSLSDSVALLQHSALGVCEDDELRLTFQSALQKALVRLLPLYHEQLLQRGEIARDLHTSWLQQWWNTLCYLQIRSPNVIHSSYFFRFSEVNESRPHAVPLDDCRSVYKNTLEKATLIIHAALQYSLPILSGNGILSSASSLPKSNTKSGSSPKPLCSAQYKYLFGTCRIPGVTSDTYRLYQFAASPSRAHSQSLPHVTVVCQGQFYNVTIGSVSNDDSNALDAPAVLSSIYHQLVAIVKDARSSRQKSLKTSADDFSSIIPELGWLTSQTRDIWYRDYQFLLENDHMRDALHSLQSSLFLLCLDDAPIDRVDENALEYDRDFAMRLWNGARGGGRETSRLHHVGGNRWYDKTIQIVMTLNETKGDRDLSFGVIGEHSMADGMPVAEFCHFLRSSLQQPHSNLVQFLQSMEDNKVETSDTLPNSPLVQNLFYDAFASMTLEEKEHLRSRVEVARSSHINATDQYDLQIFDSRSLSTTNGKEENIVCLGSDLLKKMQISPDAGVQMILQLAAYRYFDETTVATYESTHTRRFQHGRTETIRTVSSDSRTFCRTFTNALSEGKTQSQDAGAKELQRKLMELLLIACDTHAAYSRLASNGRGCDRHFFALEILANQAFEQQLEEENAHLKASDAVSSSCSFQDTADLIKERTIPSLFQDPLYQRSKRWRLSTSTLPGTSPGFGPVVPDGFGIGYDIRPQHVIYTVTAGRAENDCVRFCNALKQATLEVQELLHLAFMRGDHLESRKKHESDLLPRLSPRNEPLSVL